MRLFMPATIALASLGCNAACNPTVDFEVPIDTTTTIEGGGLLPDLLNAFGLGDFADLDLSTTREFENNDVRKEQVTATRLTKLELSLVSGDDSFDFLDSLAFSVEAPDLPKVRVASADVPDDATVVTCAIDDVELAPYVRAPSLALTADVEGRQPADDTTIRIDIVFDVTAEVIGPGTTGG